MNNQKLTDFRATRSNGQTPAQIVIISVFPFPLPSYNSKCHFAFSGVPYYNLLLSITMKNKNDNEVSCHGKFPGRGIILCQQLQNKASISRI